MERGPLRAPAAEAPPLHQKTLRYDPGVLNGNSVRELVIAASIAAGILVLAWALRAFAARKLSGAHLTDTDVDDFLLDVTRRTKLFLLFAPALFLGARALRLPADFHRGLRIVAALALVAQIALWVTGVVDFWLRRYRKSRIESDPAAVMTVNVFRVAAVAAIWIVAAIFAADNLGLNVTGLVAGLGIGGVAVALATQNILGDLFASLSIVVDKPFVLGDTIMVDAHVGTVEHIGLKTTRLRSINGEELVFSNGDLLKSRIHNFKRMAERRMVVKLAVTYQTEAATVSRIPLLLRAAVEKQPEARFDHAHFVAFGEAGYEIELVYFVRLSEDVSHLDVQQAVNLDLVAALAAEKIELAYPTRTVFMHGNSLRHDDAAFH